MGIREGLSREIESDFIEKLKQGDTAAFSALFLAYYQDLVHFACRLTSNKDVAEEIVQEAFVRLWEGREMLVQSHALEIEFLPALPDAWMEGSISGLKARGNIEIGMEWEKSRLKKASLISAVDQDVMVRYGPMRAKLKLKKGVPTVLDGSLKIAD